MSFVINRVWQVLIILILPEFYEKNYFSIFIDEKNSINYAKIKCLEILKVRLRKEILEGDDTGTESTKIASLKSRIDLLNNLIDDYNDKYDEENNNNTGRYVKTNRPVIARGDIWV